MRKISYSLYLAAFFVTLLVFSVGILLGTQLSKQAASDLQIELENMRSQSGVVEVMLLTENNSAFCSLLSAELPKFNDEASAFGQKLELLEKSRSKYDSDIKALKQSYSAMQVRNYLLVRKFDSNCQGTFSPILYFYSEKDCPGCAEFPQGVELTKAREESNGRIMVYALDTDLQIESVEAMKKLYGASSTPAIVALGKTYLGLYSKESILGFSQ